MTGDTLPNNRIRALDTRNDTLRQSLIEACNELKNAADKIDQMVNETVNGGWSTQHVEAQRKLAIELRNKAVILERR